MIEREVIELIANTYDIPREKKEKIINIAFRKAEKFSITEFEKIYDYIDFLVERFHQTPYLERFFIRLDHPRYPDSRTLEHELTEMPNHLKESNDIWLKEKLKELSLKSKEPLTILGRPVLQIEPYIKFGRRVYNEKNPLDIFYSNPKIFSGKSRTQLFQIDASLCESLRRRNQLEIAIPYIINTKFKGISKEKEEKIIRAHKIMKSPTKVAKEIGVTRATVDYYIVKKHKLRTPNKKTGNPGYPKEMIKEIIKCLKEYKKASKVAKCYGVSRWTVIKHGREAGVQILPRGGNIENILKGKKEPQKPFN